MMNIYFHYNILKMEKKKLSFLSPQILGKDYIKTVEKGDIIGLIPFKPDISFKFMTYSLIDIKGISESYIYKCNSYPFFSIDSNIFK